MNIGYYRGKAAIERLDAARRRLPSRLAAKVPGHICQGGVCAACREARMFLEIANLQRTREVVR